MTPLLFSSSSLLSFSFLLGKSLSQNLLLCVCVNQLKDGEESWPCLGKIEERVLREDSFPYSHVKRCRERVKKD